MKNILFTGGGTLGHIYPMICVVRELQYLGHDVFFIGTTSGLEKEYIEKQNTFSKTFYLNSEGIRRSLTLKNIRAVIKHFLNIRKAKKILKENSIDLVIGMGGYISATIISAAIKLNIKTMIHEQNAVLGLANKVVAKRVNKLLLTYEITGYQNSIIVGNPRISEIHEKYKFNNNYNIGGYVLVVGGSRGAQKINELIINLKEKFIKNKIKVILITGKRYYNEVITKLENNDNEYFKILDFSKDLPKLLIEAALVISRSGATTLTEILALKKVNILIPSPNVTNNHQEKNALELVKNGCSVMLKESMLSEDILFENISNLLYNNELRKRMINNINFNTKFDSKDKFLLEIKKLIN